MTEADFLKTDYELKIKYLTDHLQRMWTGSTSSLPSSRR